MRIIIIISGKHFIQYVPVVMILYSQLGCIAILLFIHSPSFPLTNAG